MPLLELFTRRKYLLLGWLMFVGTLLGLGSLRIATDAVYTYASAIIVPVIWLSWCGGFRHGLVGALLGSGMWVVSDMASEARFSADWIPFANGAIRFLTYFTVVFLTSRLADALKREAEMARHDGMTGLLNHRAFLNEGESEAIRSLRHEHAMAIGFVDLDNFKALNDRSGHAAGDEALCVVARVLNETTRTNDTVARLGGDEFAILLPEVDERGVLEVGSKLLKSLNEALMPFPGVSASIGIAWFPRPQANFETMLQAADGVMYEVKAAGKCGLLVRAIGAHHAKHSGSQPELLKE